MRNVAVRDCFSKIFNETYRQKIIHEIQVHIKLGRDEKHWLGAKLRERDQYSNLTKLEVYVLVKVYINCAYLDHHNHIHS